MFTKVLIANRGEIAVRVIRACRELGIATVAIYSTPDADALHVQLADEAVHVGPATSRLSYLNIPAIIGAARKTGAEAIHPGYGFLSEDPYFAEICVEHGITFIGPPPEVIEVLGDKAAARGLMQRAGIPLLPGTAMPVASVDETSRIAAEIGYPVVIKASAGGGGRGITVVRRPDDLPEAYTSTRAAAQQLFKDPSVYLERFLPRARHIEVQVLADSHGTVLHLGERDCSVQRRNQKLIEESPSPAVDDELRKRLGELAVRGARAAGYQGAGTVEFLLDGTGEVWFMEMNARIQVEHPVTEMVTGVDIVAEQLRIAAGEWLSLSQDDVRMRGHSLEFRINAEDPTKDYAPAPGRLNTFVLPGGPGVRIDSGQIGGSLVSPHYDSLIAKLVIWGKDRGHALDRAARALAECRMSGPGLATTVDLHQRIIDHLEFRKGTVTTDFMANSFRYFGREGEASGGPTA